MQKYSFVDYKKEQPSQAETFFQKGKNAFTGLKGVENVYTQHVPAFVELADSIVKGRLREAYFPFTDQASRERVTEIVIFLVNGATYEEAKAAANFNETSNVKIIIGGSTIHNYRSFVEEIETSVTLSHG